MLLWFPTPYPDELLYSVYARYHLRSGNTSPKMTTEDLFGIRTFRSVLDLPANVNNLIEQLGPYWDCEKMIKNHTMYSYYAPFLFPEQAEKVLKSMKSNEGSVIHTRAGVSASNVKPKQKLWVCRTCIDEDIETYGETYWHRLHQLPGVFVCPKHMIMLEETEISTGMKNQHEYIIASPDIKSYPVDLGKANNEDFAMLLAVAEQSYQILNTDYRQEQGNELREKYRMMLKKQGLVGLHGSIKRGPLYDYFQSQWHGHLLKLLQSSVVFRESDWLTMIFQKHRKSFHPLRHILIMLFLDTDINQINSEETYSPFGQGPWYCLNPACPNYKKRVVTSLKITRDYATGKPVGTFRCDCDFVYSRRGPDKRPSDAYHVGTVKDYGKVWKERLTEMVKENKSLKEISVELEANAETIKRYAWESGVKTVWKAPRMWKTKGKPLEIKDDLEDSLLSNKKKKWLEFQEEYPEASKTDIRNMAPDAYSYLYKHDREWLHFHSPKKKKMKPVNNRVDWEKRDRELLKTIQKVVQHWDEGTGKPVKISTTAIGRKIHKLSLLQKKADKLPRTMAYIRNVSEDQDQYQIRRVEAVIKKLEKENLLIREWEIYRLAGIRSTASSKVKRHISKRVNEVPILYTSVRY